MSGNLDNGASTHGRKHYYDALTAHFGKWVCVNGKKPVWVLLRDFVYSQVLKHLNRRRVCLLSTTDKGGTLNFYRLPKGLQNKTRQLERLSGIRYQ